MTDCDFGQDLGRVDEIGVGSRSAQEQRDLGGRVQRSSSSDGGDDDADAFRALHAIDDESARIRRALELAEGNRERAASMLGVSCTTLWRRMKVNGIASDN